MPIFEFQCSQCQSSFEELVRSALKTEGVTCPKCGSTEIRKKISTFASKISGGGASFSLGSSNVGGSCSTGGT